MTGWDILDTFVKAFPPVVATLLLVVAGVIFIIGFSRHGINFIKYGFKQVALDNSLEKRFDKMEARFVELEAKFDTRFVELEAKFDTRFVELETKFDTRFAAIEINHFGHLKNFLTELTSILLDKGVINNQDKARLDNKLRGM
jgi:hypothetical protein